MRISIPNVVRWHPILSLVLIIAATAPCVLAYKHYKVDDYLPVTLSAIQHLGRDYRIDSFYIDKSASGSIREGGEGGGIICCISLPKKWSPGLKADVRWEVHHIIQKDDSKAPETAEVEGIYRAQVPVEAYVKPDKFWIHFLPKGRVRIIVSQSFSSENQDLIQWNSTEESQKATTGTILKALFSNEELAELERETARNREKYGDWR